MVVRVDGDGARGDAGGQSPLVMTANALLAEVRQNVFSRQSPEVFPISNDRWGSFTFRPGEVIAIAAPPGMGKTALITQASIDALRLNRKATCLTVNVEMPPQVILERQLSRLSSVPYADIAGRQFLDLKRDAIENAFATLEEVGDRLMFMPPPFTIAGVIEAIHGAEPRIVVLDYMQRIECGSDTMDARLRLNQLMHEARQIANAGVCCVLISAVGRTPSKKDGGYASRELGLGSFRESSEIEYGVDEAFVLVEESSDAITGRRTVRLKHVKSRNHRRVDLRLEFDGSIQAFRLLSDEEADAAAHGFWQNGHTAAEGKRRSGRYDESMTTPNIDAFPLGPDDDGR
jgi:replicative DNA helicase